MWEDFKSYALSKKDNLDIDVLRLKYDSWIESDWSVNRNGKQQPIKNWKSTLLNTIPFIKINSTVNNLQTPKRLKDLYE